MSVQVDMEKVTAQTVQQLGGQLAMLTLELNAQLAAKAALEARIAELEKPAEGAGD